jgi:hypothetical protein
MSRPRSGRYVTTAEGKAWAPSVTTVLNVLNKPGLSWGAAKETALFAIHHRDQWEHLDETEAYHRLRKHHAGVWNDKANRGTLVHDLALTWAKGQDVDCPPECGPYMDALERFYVEHDPQWLTDERLCSDENPTGLACEQWIAYNHETLGYGGSFDKLGRLGDGRVYGLDIKTGQRYPVETTLQLAAYFRGSDGIAVRSPLGGVEQIIPWSEFPPIDACGVLYLHDDGTYELLEVPADEQAVANFLHLRAVWGWLKEMERWLKRNPAPAQEEENAA